MSNGKGPPDKTATLVLLQYPDSGAFNDAVSSLYDQGYEYAFQVTFNNGDEWIVFQGYADK